MLYLSSNKSNSLSCNDLYQAVPQIFRPLWCFWHIITYLELSALLHKHTSSLGNMDFGEYYESFENIFRVMQTFQLITHRASSFPAQAQAYHDKLFPLAEKLGL